MTLSISPWLSVIFGHMFFGALPIKMEIKSIRNGETDRYLVEFFAGFHKYSPMNLISINITIISISFQGCEVSHLEHSPSWLQHNCDSSVSGQCLYPNCWLPEMVHQSLIKCQASPGISSTIVSTI